MKMIYLPGFAAVLAASIGFSSGTVLAQDATTDVSATAVAAPAAPTPQFGYGVSQILRLSDAKVPDDTIVTYIKGSGSSYGLTADQIIYLQQHGVSSPVINAMLTQPRVGSVAYSSAPAPEAVSAPPVPSTPAPAPVYEAQPSSTVVVTPPVTAIDPSATAYYYSSPSYYYPYYGYGYYSPVVFSVGWGGYGWRGGYGWHGGYYRGGFGGGGFHGGFGGGFHGGVGGGFHGGGGWHR